jgi:ABC-type lipopolysaccharide export system ATPase subunit
MSLKICDRAYVLEGGSIALSGSREEIVLDQRHRNAL